VLHQVIERGILAIYSAVCLYHYLTPKYDRFGRPEPSRFVCNTIDSHARRMLILPSRKKLLDVNQDVSVENWSGGLRRQSCEGIRHQFGRHQEGRAETCSGAT
jgi:hypothetical protein